MGTYFEYQKSFYQRQNHRHILSICFINIDQTGFSFICKYVYEWVVILLLLAFNIVVGKELIYTLSCFSDQWAVHWAHVSSPPPLVWLHRFCPDVHMGPLHGQCLSVSTRCAHHQSAPGSRHGHHHCGHRHQQGLQQVSTVNWVRKWVFMAKYVVWTKI